MMKQSSPAVVALRNQLMKKLEQAHEWAGQDQGRRDRDAQAAWEEFRSGLHEILASEIKDKDDEHDVYEQELEEARMHAKAVV